MRPSELPKEKLPATIWNQIEAEARKQEASGGRVILMHVGDAHRGFPPALTEPAPDEDARFASRLNRYSDTFGEAPLRELILEKVVKRNRLPAGDIDCIQITAGATGALHGAFCKLLDPGAQILVLSPYWSILRNVADTAGVDLVEVPFFDQLPPLRSSGQSKELPPLRSRGGVRGGSSSDQQFDIASHLQRFVTPRTAALYLNTPSNPTGMLLDHPTLEALTAFARMNDLWVFSDEAYEDFIWDGGEHISIGSLPGMWERTVSIYTFSKCFGSSGIRVGYAAAPPAVISRINRGVVGACYQAPRLGQLYAWRGMQRFDEALHWFYDDYHPTWRYVAENLHCEMMPCAGTFYYFIKLPESWRGVAPEAKITRMLKSGVVVSPGEYFGRDYDGWARLCFTAVPPADVREGVKRLNQLLTGDSEG